ncbi:hypothetical protein K3495_g13542 [Podosphaera aphanis]|nr:hypothetical protein K3495_g13542 [Podosphaera aphanis]
MQYSSAILIAFAITNVFAQGAVNSIRSTNDIDVANLHVDGTPGDCSSPDCISGSVDIVHNVSEKKSKNSDSAGAFRGSIPVEKSKNSGSAGSYGGLIPDVNSKNSDSAGAFGGSIPVEKSKNSDSAGTYEGLISGVNSSSAGALLRTDIAVEVDQKKTKSSALAGAIEGSIDIVDTSESNQKRSIEKRLSKLRFARALVSKA